MNIEVEMKIKIDNFEAIKKKVMARGKLEKAIRQVDEYYVPNHRNFFAAKPFPVEWLRIRTNPDKTVLEYDLSVNKDANGIQEYTEEYETEISNPGELRKILGFLDFKKVVTVDKQREYWQCGEIEVALDRIAGLGDFIEAEAKGNFASNKEAKKACIRFLAEIGIKNADKIEINKGYPVLLLEKKR